MKGTYYERNREKIKLYNSEKLEVEKLLKKEFKLTVLP